MLILADKALILLICSASLLGRELSVADLCALLFSISVCCIGQAAVKEMDAAWLKRLVKNVLESAYCLCCIFFPLFTAFLPLVVYETVRTRDYAPMAFGGIALVCGFYGGSFPLYPLLICLAAVYSCVKTQNSQSLSRQNIKNRDDSAELEKVMRSRNRELEENLQYELRINTLNERNRIAREIHDNVGHLLSRALLQTGALSALCPKEQETLKGGLEGLKDSLNSAMNSIRESVHGIRDDSLELKIEANKILSPLTERYSVELDYDISENVPPKIKLCFIYVLREAASNIIRHSSGDRVSVILREHPSLYQLIISDNGNAQAAPSAEGMGLSNMEERVRSVGGNFSINTEKGFSVFVSVRKESL